MKEQDCHAMMQSMMRKCSGDMDADEMKGMCVAMMGRILEDLDVEEAMPEMMTAMTSRCAGRGSGRAEGETTGQSRTGAEQRMSQMPELMLKSMMPHCIGMMLPAIDVERRGEVAAAILSSIVEKGSAGMSERQARSFIDDLGRVLRAPARSGTGSSGGLGR